MKKWSTRFKLKNSVWVFVPTKETNEIGINIKNVLSSRWRPPTYYFHLQKGGHIQAINIHLSKKYFAHVDIKNFFGSINRTRVTRCLKSLTGYESARKIANESCVIHPLNKCFILPFGFPQSPIISSICLHKSVLGKFLERTNKSKNVNLSLYVDDIIISSENESELKNTLILLNEYSEKSGFKLNTSKTQSVSEKIDVFNIEISNKSKKINELRMNSFIEAFKKSRNLYEKEGIRSYVLSVNEAQESLL